MKKQSGNKVSQIKSLRLKAKKAKGKERINVLQALLRALKKWV